MNHPDLFGTMIPTDSEIKPTNGSRREMIDRFFDGDTTAYENQVPVNAIPQPRAHPSDAHHRRGRRTPPQYATSKQSRRSRRKPACASPPIESSGNAHDWHAVRDVLRYGLAVFGHDTGLDGCEPEPIRLSEISNASRYDDPEHKPASTGNPRKGKK